MEAPMPNLVTEPTKLPCGALFVAVVSIVRTALTAVEVGELYLWVSLGLLGNRMHGHLIKCWPL